MRKIKFVNGGYYHIYNRGVDKRKIFLEGRDYVRFLRSMREFSRVDPIGSIYQYDYLRKCLNKRPGSQLGTGSQTKRLIEIVCYCLLPNHYHLLIKQVKDKGVEKYLHKLSLGYSCYFNKKIIKMVYCFKENIKQSL
jgi:putative transposase